MKPKLYFRADGNSEIGLGHVMRCLALAENFSISFHTIFLIQTPEPSIQKSILQICSEVISLPSTTDYSQDVNSVCTVIQDEFAILILDGYSFDSKYQKKLLNNKLKTIFIDDLQNFYFYTDVVINHSGNVLKENYLKEFYTRVYTGAQYAILRKPFLVAASQNFKFKDGRSVFINMGGADIYNKTKEVLVKCLNISEIEKIIIVIGGVNKHKGELIQIKQEHPLKTIEILENLSAEEMSSVMAASDIGICSASTVAYEYCSVGGTLFLIQTAGNQKNIFQYLISEGLAFDFEDFEEVFFDENRKRASQEKQNKVFDGKSVERISNVINTLQLEGQIDLRKPSMNDLLLYFNWANDPVVRNNSINKTLISLEDHTKWFVSKIKDANTIMYLFEKDGIPVGQVRFDKQGENYLIGFSVDKDVRGKGIGEIILRKAILRLKAEKGNISLVAVVEVHNQSSEKIFKKMGFNEEDNELYKKDKFFYFKLSLQ